MAAITTVVHFSGPREHIEEHLANWRHIADIMVKQPGAQHGILYRCIDEDSPFQFVNVAHWESPEALANALRATAEERKRVNRRAILTRFGVKSASKIDHPILFTVLPAVRSELGCCAWKRLARFADGGWCRESRSVRLRGTWGYRATRSNERCARRASGLSTGARVSRGQN